jgi:hypothetical protein
MQGCAGLDGGNRVVENEMLIARRVNADTTHSENEEKYISH